jgi:hypothetical protein
LIAGQGLTGIGAFKLWVDKLFKLFF